MTKYNRAYRKFTFLAILSLTVIITASCGTKKSSVQRGFKGVSTEEEKNESTLTGVVVNVDSDLKQVTIRELESDVENLLNYSALSVITNKFGQEIEGEEIEVGQIFEASYTPENGKIVTMSVPEDAWEYQDVSSFSFDGDISALSFAGERFQYTESTYFEADGKTVQPMEINNEDCITVRGVGINVYSVVRTAGHGYIRLANYDDFIGGMVSIGNGIIVPVTENMLITVGEGTYKVTISKGMAVASKKVTVRDNKEVTVDFSDYVPSISNIGNITFKIDPKGADLYINGTMVDYSSPIALNYGEYKVRVELTGYTTYNGILDVEDAAKTINISLIEENASVAKSTATPTPSSTSSAGSDKSSNVVTKKTDSKHTIKVLGPKGAAVYLDNVYQGVAPCEFTKIIGSQTITLSKNGYISKSYSINVLDDGKDAKFDFPELIEESSDNKKDSTDNETNDKTDK